MKKHLLSLLAAICLSFAGFGQVTVFTVYNLSDTMPGCTNHLAIQMDGNFQNETGVDVDIDWGDGNTTEEELTSPNDFWYYMEEHAYATAGSYTVTVTVFSQYSNAFVGTPQTLTWNARQAPFCGWGYFWISDPFNEYHNTVLLDFTGNDGTVTTMANIAGNFNYLTYADLDVTNAPYTVSVNDNWLAGNNRQQSGPDITITGFSPDDMASFQSTGGSSGNTLTLTCVDNTQTDFSLYAYAWNFVAPLQTGTLAVTPQNFGCNDVADATVSIVFPAGLVPTTSGLQNPVVTGNTLTFEVDDLEGAGESILISFGFPGATPSGTVFDFTVSISGANDIDLNNNTIDCSAIVVNSYDPNSKEVNHPAEIDVETVETFNYVINFQNEGNGDAYTVVLRDTISSLLDLSTFKLVNHKHPVSYSIDQSTREIVFTFNNIGLVPKEENEEDSKGFVIYSIKENAGLAENSDIRNTAYIYFDFNPAIITNTTSNLNVSQTLGQKDLKFSEIVLYPNPARNVVSFKSDDKISNVKITDHSGRVVYEGTPTNNEVSLEALSGGLYNVHTSTKKGTSVQKLTVIK